jgi:thiol-disulfide isomerase/thioredoxin
LGALYGLFNKISFFGVKVNMDKCTHCNLCISHCKLDIHHVGDQECISCGECIGVCPTKAIQWKGGKILLRANEGQPETNKKRNTVTRIITAIVMVAVLAGAIGYYWNQEDVRNLAIAGNEDRGNQLGDLCYNADLEIVDATGILTETIDPTATGKITIVNFWGTWCTPCVNELPYFDEIATNYADSVTVIAIHTNMISETAPGFIASHYPDSNIVFARDFTADGTTVEQYYTALGGRGTYPYTVILDENGVVIALFVEALEYEDLAEVVEAQLSK